MSRTFAYCRVSTSEQLNENQIVAIRQAGFDILASRIISEAISGDMQAIQRKTFADMVTYKPEKGDRLVVFKLDGLGCDNIDVQQTIALLVKNGWGM